MICLNCQNELNEKATKRKKYCSDSCRVSAYIKRSGYKPLGNIKNVKLGQIEANSNQFKPKENNSFENFGIVVAGAGLVQLANNALSSEKLSKTDFDNFRTELKQDLIQL